MDDGQLIRVTYSPPTVLREQLQEAQNNRNLELSAISQFSNNSSQILDVCDLNNTNFHLKIKLYECNLSTDT